MQLTALARLEEAGITGADAVTCLDTLIARAVAETTLEPGETRHDALVRRFGSDACRAARVLEEARQ